MADAPMHFEYPFDCEVAKENKDVEKAVVRLLGEAGVYDEFPSLLKTTYALRPGKIGPYFFPYATQDKMIVMTLFLVVFFLYDDILEGCEEEDIDSLMASSTGELQITAETRSLVRAIAKTGEAVREMPERWMKQFKVGMRKYFESLKIERDHLELMSKTHEHPSIPGFIQWRRWNVGGLVVCNMVEFGMNNCLPEEWQYNPTIIEIQELWNRVFYYQNDYISATSGRDDGKLNVAWAIGRDFSLDSSESRAVLMTIHDMSIQKIMRLSSEISKVAPDLVKVWLSNLAITFVGSARFHEEAERYHRSA